MGMGYIDICRMGDRSRIGWQPGSKVVVTWVATRRTGVPDYPCLYIEDAIHD